MQPRLSSHWAFSGAARSIARAADAAMEAISWYNHVPGVAHAFPRLPRQARGADGAFAPDPLVTLSRALSTAARGSSRALRSYTEQSANYSSFLADEFCAARDAQQATKMASQTDSIPAR
jgi:hypothetical protein